MKLSSLITKTALGVSLLLSADAAMAACGNIEMAEMNWASAELMANVDKVILEKGYGCKVSLVPGATTTTFASMNEKGRPHIAGELWINAVREPLNKAFAAKTLHSSNSGPINDIGEGWWIPAATLKKHPELKTVMDVLKRPELFPDKEDPSKGAFVGCPAGWGCQLANNNLFRAFGMEKMGWKQVDPGSAAGLDGSLSKAVERDQNWFGYYWTPTALMFKYEMVKLPFGVPFAGSENWDGCIAKAEAECANPKPSAWTKSEVHTVVTDKFKKDAGPEVMAYLNKRVYGIESMTSMLKYMADEQAEGKDAAVAFLSVNDHIWSTWVTPEAAAKIKAGL